MRLEKLQPPAREVPDTKPRTVKVPVSTGHVTITYRPVEEGADALPDAGLLRKHLSDWDVEDSEGQPVPVTTDTLRSLSPEVTAALREAILAGKTEPEEKGKKG